MSLELILSIALAVVTTAVVVSYIGRRSSPNVGEIVDTYSDLSRRVRELEADHAADRGQIRSLEDRMHKLLRVTSMMSDGIRALTGQITDMGVVPDWEPPDDVEGWLNHKEQQSPVIDDVKIKLLSMINQWFNLNEVRGLMYELGIDDDQFVGQTKLDKVQELVGYCMRRNQTSELVRACREHRPHLEWPQV